MKNWFKKKSSLPTLSSPYNQAVRRQQSALALTLLITILIAGIYTYFYAKKQTEARSLQSVIVVAQDITAPKILENSDLKIAKIPQSLLPENALRIGEKEHLIGQTAIEDLEAKQILLPSDLRPNLDPDSISAQFNSDFALSMDEDWFAAKFPSLEVNDQVDLIVTNPRDQLESTTVIARNLTVIQIDQIKNKRQLVLNTTEDQAKAILFAHGLKIPMQLLIHSAIKP